MQLKLLHQGMAGFSENWSSGRGLLSCNTPSSLLIKETVPLCQWLRRSGQFLGNKILIFLHQMNKHWQMFGLFCPQHLQDAQMSICCQWPEIHCHFFGLQYVNVLGGDFRPISEHFKNKGHKPGLSLQKQGCSDLVISKCNDVVTCILALPDAATVPLKNPSASISYWDQCANFANCQLKCEAGCNAEKSIETRRTKDFAISKWDKIKFIKVQSASSTPLLDLYSKWRAKWLWTLSSGSLPDTNDFMVIQWQYENNKKCHQDYSSPLQPRTLSSPFLCPL